MAKTAAAEPRMPVKVGAQLPTRGVHAVLVQMADQGQIIQPRCEMPTFRCAQSLRTSTRGLQLASSGSYRKPTIRTLSLTADAEILGTFASRTYSAATRPTVGDRA